MSKHRWQRWSEVFEEKVAMKEETGRKIGGKGGEVASASLLSEYNAEGWAL